MTLRSIALASSLALHLVACAHQSAPARASAAASRSPLAVQTSDPSVPSIALAAGPFVVPADERVSAADPTPDPPALPTVPAALQSQLTALKGVAQSTSECWNTRPEQRIYHAAHPRCAEWFEALARGGEAGVHAIGQALVEFQTFASAEPVERLAQVLAHSRNPAATPYIARALVAFSSRNDLVSALALAHAFEQCSGFPVSELPSWRNPWDVGPPVARAWGVRALRYAERTGLDEARMRREGRERLLAWLTGDDARVVNAARIVLERAELEGELRAPAASALERLIARPDATSDARTAARALLARLRG